MTRRVHLKRDPVEAPLCRRETLPRAESRRIDRVRDGHGANFFSSMPCFLFTNEVP